MLAVLSCLLVTGCGPKKMPGMDAAPPALPPIVPLDNACRPGDCLGWDWEVETAGADGVGVQILDWVEPTVRNRVRLRALPQVLTPEEAIAWLESGPGVLIEGQEWRELALTATMDDGFALDGRLGIPDYDYDFGWGQYRGVYLRVVEGVQVICWAEHWRSHDGLDQADGFCYDGWAGGDRAPDHGLTDHSWVATRAGWALPAREHLAAHATYLWGEAQGHERTQVQLRDPHEPVDAEHWLTGLAEPGFLNSSFLWSEAQLTRELEGGFLIEGLQHVMGMADSTTEPAFVVIRNTGGHPIVCHPITLEQPEHYDEALEFCLEGFEAGR
jgi:hypothetical protein